MATTWGPQAPGGGALAAFRQRFGSVPARQSRCLIIPMAAATEADSRTRVALTGGIRLPGHAALLPISVRHEARRSLERLEALLHDRA